MDTLTPRQKEVLNHIIDLYLETMQPVGSRIVTKRFEQPLSAATIRNEMCDLEDMGYITHPHTSAGRVPTDKGYRYYVDNLLQTATVPYSVVQTIKKEFKQKIDSLEDLIVKTTHVLSTITHETCVSILFQPQCYYFKQVNLVALDAKRVLVIWVTTTGVVTNDIVEFADGVVPDELERMSRFLNAELAGLSLPEIEEHIVSKLLAERNSLYQLYERAGQIVKATLIDKKDVGTVCLDGRNYLLDKPEFSDLARTKRLFALLDDKEVLLNIFGRRHTHSPAGMSIRIGQEIETDDLRDCSLIGARYMLRDTCVGTINILGPKRICYRSSIGLLQLMSKMMTETMQTL